MNLKLSFPCFYCNKYFHYDDKPYYSFYIYCLICNVGYLVFFDKIETTIYDSKIHNSTIYDSVIDSFDRYKFNPNYYFIYNMRVFIPKLNIFISFDLTNMQFTVYNESSIILSKIPADNFLYLNQFQLYNKISKLIPFI